MHVHNYTSNISQSTIDSERFKGGARGAPIMPRDAVSRTANVERTGRHKWVEWKNTLQLANLGPHIVTHSSNGIPNEKPLTLLLGNYPHED